MEHPKREVSALVDVVALSLAGSAGSATEERSLSPVQALRDEHEVVKGHCGGAQEVVQTVLATKGTDLGLMIDHGEIISSGSCRRGLALGHRRLIFFGGAPRVSVVELGLRALSPTLPPHHSVKFKKWTRGRKHGHGRKKPRG